MIPIALILVGLVLILVEVYMIPGFNVIGILGIIMIIVAVGYAFAESGWTGGFMALAGSGAAVGGLFWFLYSSGAWDRFVLTAELASGASDGQEDREQRTRYLGRFGTALTPLRPSGVIEIDGTRLEVSTEGEFIAAGSKVRVVAMDRRRYFVRLASEATEAAATPDS
ncbi:MAG: NfeD family protein [Rhodothermales bacterium]|nr:NfeD family protein [Rhodothermales bacterium]